MIDYYELKIGDHILYLNHDHKIWLGKIISISNPYYIELERIYSNAYNPNKKYFFNKSQCTDKQWSIPSYEEIRNYYKLVIFE